MGINILVFIYEAQLPPEALQGLIFQMGLIPAEVTTGASAANLLTSMFLHGGVLHLAGNMLYLFIFGNNVEDSTGHFRFLVFYILCGLGAASMQIAASPASETPMIGASGAIAGVLGAYMLLFPKARVLTLVPIFFFIQMIHVPAIVVLGIWFVYQILLSAATPAGSGGVAFFAHIGGFVAGLVLIWIFKKPRAD